MEIINAPSLANCDFLNFRDQIFQLVDGGCQWFHIDIMDGHYVPNLCFPVRLVKELKQTFPAIQMDVHLMVTDPMTYIAPLRESGADWVSFHLDSTPFARRGLAAIRAQGMKAGIVINPSQPISLLEPLIGFVDYIVLMTVEPGYAGQRFLPDSLSRLEQLVQLRGNRPIPISIDGGVDMYHAAECARRGAQIFCNRNLYGLQPTGQYFRCLPTFSERNLRCCGLSFSKSSASFIGKQSFLRQADCSPHKQTFTKFLQLSRRIRAIPIYRRFRLFF